MILVVGGKEGAYGPVPQALLFETPFHILGNL